MNNKSTLSAAIIFLSLVVSATASAQLSEQDSFRQLDADFQALSANLYQYYVNQHQNRLGKTDNIETLRLRIEQLNATEQPLDGIAYALLNFSTIAENINDPTTIYVLELLLEHNEFDSAEKLYEIIYDEADDFTAAKADFLFARYYFRRNEWALCADYLADILNNNLLSDQDLHYALILNGILLQYKKQHRQAMEHYRKIPADSAYYLHGQINTAVVNIRQGWWTDAHIIINRLLNNPELIEQENAGENNASGRADMVNRLHVILGYSMLRNEFYRYAREAFRNVAIDSPYANRALLGIGLSAAGQEDYVGALNAFTRLSELAEDNIYKDEAQLLRAYTYDRLKQRATAARAYENAIEYYQRRISQLQNLSVSDDGINAHVYTGATSTRVSLKNQAFDIGDGYYPKVLLNNFSALYHFKNHFATTTDNPQLVADINAVYQQYEAAYRALLTTAVNHYSEAVASYLSQARYRLATVYDNRR